MPDQPQSSSAPSFLNNDPIASSAPLTSSSPTDVISSANSDTIVGDSSVSKPENLTGAQENSEEPFGRSAPIPPLPSEPSEVTPVTSAGLASTPPQSPPLPSDSGSTPSFVSPSALEEGLTKEQATPSTLPATSTTAETKPASSTKEENLVAQETPVNLSTSQGNTATTQANLSEASTLAQTPFQGAESSSPPSVSQEEEKIPLPAEGGAGSPLAEALPEEKKEGEDSPLLKKEAPLSFQSAKVVFPASPSTPQESDFSKPESFSKPAVSTPPASGENSSSPATPLNVAIPSTPTSASLEGTSNQPGALSQEKPFSIDNFQEEMPPVSPPPPESIRPVFANENAESLISPAGSSTSGERSSISGTTSSLEKSPAPLTSQEQVPVASSAGGESVEVTTGKAASNVVRNLRSPAVGDAILPPSNLPPTEGLSQVTSQPAVSSSLSSPPIPKAGGSFKWLIILLLILGLVGGGGYYLYTSGYLQPLLASLPFFNRGEEEFSEEVTPSPFETFTPTATPSPLAESEQPSPTPSPEGVNSLSGTVAVDLSTPAGRDEKRKSDIDAIGEALDAYAKDHLGRVPEAKTAVNLSVNPSVLEQVLVPKYLKELPKDPGNGYYSYKSDGQKFTLSAALEVSTDSEGVKVGSKVLYIVEGPLTSVTTAIE